MEGTSYQYQIRADILKSGDGCQYVKEVETAVGSRISKLKTKRG